MHQPSTTKTICFSRFVCAMPAFAYVINWQMKRFFLMGLITTRFFLFMLKLKWLKNGGAKAFIAIYIFFKIITLFIKYKSDIVFSVFFFTGSNVKGTTKLYFVRCCRVVIVFFSRGLYKTAFSTYCVDKTSFLFSSFLCFGFSCFYFFCS